MSILNTEEGVRRLKREIERAGRLHHNEVKMRAQMILSLVAEAETETNFFRIFLIRMKIRKVERGIIRDGLGEEWLRGVGKDRKGLRKRKKR